ncbi:MAG: hypothetical protein NT076_02870, partial [Candidatus Pacearchaeota archaeon]|nr:hypothetical protein [Candidatus Pacearchaeota archaeon]
MTKSKFFPALAVLVGTTIGAGFLGIPYVVSKAGFIPGAICLLLIAGIMLCVKLYLGEVILRTNGNHQLVGYSERYLGKKGKVLMFFSMIFGIYSALTAYLIAEGESFSYLFTGSLSYSFFISLAFWIVMAGFSYVGLKALKKYEKIGMIFVLLLIIFIAAFYFPGIRKENLSYLNYKNMFLPFGVILFSFLAFSAMPEVKRLLYGQEKLMKKVIKYGVMIPLVVYFLFLLVIVGNFGLTTSEIATLNLARIFSLLGILTMFTAYFTLSLAIRDMFRFDFKLGRFRGWLLATAVPLILFILFYFFRVASFTQILSI